MHSHTASSSRPKRSRRIRKILAVVGVIFVLLIAGVLWAAHTYGPRMGFYLIPPSPEQYGQIAIEHLNQGYRASGDEWDTARAALEQAAADADDYSDLYDEIAAATTAAGGQHSVFLDPEETNEYADSSTAKYEAPTVTTVDGVTTIVLPALGAVSGDLQQEYAQTAADGIADAAPDTCGWIVDLRGNTGGNMYPMLSGVSALLPNGTAFSFTTRTEQMTPVTVYNNGVGLGSTTISVGEQSKITDAPIAVLQDSMTASSGEAVATSFRGLDHVESFGTDSYGYTSGNVPRTLYDGAQIVLTTSVYVDRDGVSLDEQPIEADHPTTADDADEQATQWVQEQGCS
ncbi:S41 family peptidase [Microbacterium sp. A94]|uniref:S41 family peptidase n=1 Tax=Microbacterium sp. A94 TaxID=3450717 RepID=UPI003F432E9C